MVKKANSLLDLVLRYLLLLVVALPNLWLFYTIFTPLTAYPVYWLLNVFFDASLLSKTLILLNQSFPIELIDACIAGSAYYLLLILNLSTPKIQVGKRVKMILAAFGIFLVINILRIFLLSILAFNGSSFFDITHIVFWYLLSTIFVVGIWFWEVKRFKIKNIPFYSDIRHLYKNVK